jgi:hypothetical protein
MNVYTCNTFRGHWPVGSAAVVVAQSAEMAAESLEIYLSNNGLAQTIKTEDMERLSTYVPTIRILNDGNY